MPIGRSGTLPVTGADVSLLAGTHGSHERLAHVALEPLPRAMRPGIRSRPFPLEIPSSAGLGARGCPSARRWHHDAPRGVPSGIVARKSRQVDRLLALLREHDVPAMEWTVGPGPLPVKPKRRLRLARRFICGIPRTGLALGRSDGRRTVAKGAGHKPQAKGKTATFLSSLEDLNVATMCPCPTLASQIPRPQTPSVKISTAIILSRIAGRRQAVRPVERLTMWRGIRSGRPCAAPERLGGNQFGPRRRGCQQTR